MRRLFIQVVFIVSILTQFAFAQEATDVAARQDLLRRAQAASGDGHHTEALDFATRAGRISMTPSLRAFTAHEQSALGLVAEALGNAQQCIHEIAQNTALEQRDAISEACQTIIRDVEPRVARITVEVTNPPEATSVTVGGRALNSAFYGSAYVVNPGDVAVEANSPGHERFRQTVHVRAGENRSVSVLLPLGNEQVTASPAPTIQVRTESTGPSGFSVAMMGIGVVGLVGSIVLFVLKLSATSQFEQQECMPPAYSFCRDTPSSHSMLNDVGTFGIAADVALIVGIAGLAGGIIPWVIRRSVSHDSPAHARLNIVPTRDGAFVGVGGSF